jgi:uncharacterized protein YfiM (DUF2279 family)
MNLLNKLLIPQDKANHFVYGATISALAIRASGSRNAGLVAAAVFAIGKELYDWITGKGSPDWHDAAWTILGGVVVWAGGDAV